ncbi:lipoate--protein ligase family protein [Blastopirellula sp. JC732]|uniref:Lipoate--protein ligase family protein n=1 Tax=Blastopirellula sediminis TaxID=2894196 RepID=A0A9X1MPP7_9BACT|nr:lipoate--protein ligase family protein [Blastopirellula sediminis]MCC9606953.1 lipoate--protein ligase family protein [Blastopirellula sediminis]MCC9629752.1 lipoate--protein ligase family protein [Blastopirellula sediminis]
MYLFDLTLPTPEENLALDEALLEANEAGELVGDVLRLWEPTGPLAVIGRASRIAEEANLPACAERGVPVFRRTSGGAAIVAGPGCLMYAVTLSLANREHLRAIDLCHQYVMEKMLAALSPYVEGVAFQGTCDLTWNNRKFSGNSLRVKRDHVLYHGTLLYDFPLELIADCLRHPPRTPDYREQRDHTQFVTNLPISREQLKAALIETWGADQPLTEWPQQRTADLVAERYATDEWNQMR